MTGRYEKAELLTSLWKLAADGERLPTSHGILDRALKECVASLPRQLADGLTFGRTGVGLRCYQLPDILLAAQEAMLTSEPNPTYLSSIVTVDETRARQIAVSYGLTTAEARSMGFALLDAVHSARSKVLQPDDNLTVA